MRALVSLSAGCVVPLDTDSSCAFTFSGHELGERETRDLLTLLPDWAALDWTDGQQIPTDLWTRHKNFRAASLVEEVLLGLSASLRDRVIGRVEELFTEGAVVETVLSHLLRAPLRREDVVGSIGKEALQRGCATTAHLLDQLRILQPLLRRFTAVWLRQDDARFGVLGRTRQNIWNQIVTKGTLLQLLQAPTGRQFLRVWDAAFLATDVGAGLPVLHQLGQSLVHSIFVDRREVGGLRETVVEDHDLLPGTHSSRKGNASGQAKGKRAQTQIVAIAKAVAEGQDGRALSWLRDLMKSQSDDGDVEYAVKSLCNIAQRCAEMFRSDFERICLDEARKLSTSDSWMLVQFGDHLKRMGKYDEALECLRLAASLGDRVALSAQADVWAHRGEYARALAEYDSIPGADADEIILTARADIYRRMGQQEKAWQLYEHIIKLPEFEQSARAQAGKATILKQRGEYAKAVDIFERLVSNPRVSDPRVQFLNRLSLCSSLKLADKLDAAFRVADELLADAPFYMAARMQRASIHALLGKGKTALQYLPPQREARGYGEWRQNYFRGLVLFKLRRYQDAEAVLLSNQELDAAADSDGTARLAAALAYLRMNRSGEDRQHAQRLIDSVAPPQDALLAYLKDVLTLHLAAIRHNKAIVDRICDELVAKNPGAQIISIVTALRKNKLPDIVDLEIDVFLKAA